MNMMIRRTAIKRWQDLAVIVTCLLCVALESAQSASSGQVKGQQQQQLQTKSSSPVESQIASANTQSKRVSSSSSLPVTDGSIKTPKAAGDNKSIKSAPTKDGLMNKFQARMMRSDLNSAHSQEGSYGPPMEGSQNSDIWQANGALVPTFTDQEQGDEMIALASDIAESEQAAAPLPQSNPTINRLRPGSRSPYPARDGADQVFAEKIPARDQAATDNRQVGKLPLVSARQTAAASVNIDEYYNDEDEDEDEPSKQPGEFEPVEPKEKLASSSRYRYNPQSEHFGDYQPSSAPIPFEESSSYRGQLPDQAAGNKSSPIVKVVPSQNSQVNSGGWQPKSSSSRANNYQETQKAHEPSQIGQQRPSQPNDNGQHSSATAKRLATLLGGGRDSLGAFSRADVAIEYLRNMLKNKQQQGSANNANYSSVESSPKQQFDSSITDRNISLQRLSSFASKLNQIFNATSAKSASSNDTNVRSEQAPLQSKFEPKKSAVNFGSDPTIHLDLTEQPAKTFLSHQADTKFSIVDAKPSPTGSKLQIDNGPQPTTGLPSLALGDGGSADGLNLYQQSSQYSQDISLTNQGAANGTPLGGDYIESQDDFPRAGVSRLPHPNPLGPTTLVGSESQQVPVKSFQINGEFLDPALLDHTALSNPHKGKQEQAISSTYFQMHQLPPVGYPHPSTGQPGLTVTGENSRKLAAPIDSQRSLASISQAPSFMQEQQQQFKPIAQALVAKPGHPSNQTAGRDLKYDEQNRQSLVLDRFPTAQQLQQQQQKYMHQQVIKLDHQSTGQQVPLSSSKLYKNEQASLSIAPEQQQSPTNSPNQVSQQQERKQHTSIDNNNVASPYHQQQQQVKPPKIVSFNYFESPNEPGQNEYLETNYQLGDALYSSNGGMEHLLSGSELDAIRNQFMTVDHPVVPIRSAEQQIHAKIQQQQQQLQQNRYPDSGLSGLLASLKNEPSFTPPEGLQKLSSPERQAEEMLKELASQEQPTRILAPSASDQVNFERTQGPRRDRQPFGQESGRVQSQEAVKILNGEPTDSRKKKSLIVYLNHPRPVDMSKASSMSPSDGYNLAQSIGDQPNKSTFASAKEFDSHGLSKDTKHLDVSSLQGLGEIKDGQDKDGLSVVVIGDAYKYKKIVLLISSKAGGLKFIPMVKDMKK